MTGSTPTEAAVPVPPDPGSQQPEQQQESNLILHAKRELTALGYDLSQTEEDPNKWIAEWVLELVRVFANQGHSGGSAPECVRLFKELAMFQPLCPITGQDEEWNEVQCGEEPLYQNNRCSAVFKGKDGRAYYLKAIVWKTQKGMTYTGRTSDGTTSRQLIKFPFTPKTFIVDVEEREIAPGDWEFDVKDQAQLEPVFDYYEKRETVG